MTLLSDCLIQFSSVQFRDLSCVFVRPMAAREPEKNGANSGPVATVMLLVYGGIVMALWNDAANSNREAQTSKPSGPQVDVVALFLQIFGASRPNS